MSSSALAKNEDTWIGMFDAENPKSVISRVPTRLKQAMLAIPENVRQMDEEELLRHSNPPASLCEARVKFWKVMDLTEGTIKISDIFKNRNTFYTMSADFYRMMFFLTPPVDYLNTQEAILERSLKTLHAFISGDHMWKTTEIEKTDRYGETTKTVIKEINVKAVEAARKIYETMSDRLHGAVAMNLKIQGQHAHAILTPEQKILGMDVSQIMALGSCDDGRKDMPPVLQPGEKPPEDIVYGSNDNAASIPQDKIIDAYLSDFMADED